MPSARPGDATPKNGPTEHRPTEHGPTEHRSTEQRTAERRPVPEATPGVPLEQVGDGALREAGEGPVPEQGKGAKVRQMFADIAPTYDLLNRLLSFGVDRRWRAQAAERVLAGLPPAASGTAVRVLDVACGTGDLTFELKRRRPDAEVLGADFAEPMLKLARSKAQQRGLFVEFLAADGTRLPFEGGSFDAVTIAYGLRNFADPDAGLREFRRVLKPGGRLAVLEFPPPPGGPFGTLFRFYFRRVLPWLGGVISGERSAYAYLPESVFAFFTPEELERRLHAAGFAAVAFENQTFGVSALHVAEAPPERRER